ncbi:nucleoside phosphatase family-domain-containing protein [Mycena rebaudengoi]|nr:nucleoside phosphatase family-domain-containing protein [Mycena rebaudengoi]
MSPIYDRLEAGRPASPKTPRGGKNKRFGWKRFALAAVVLLGLEQRPDLHMPGWSGKEVFEKGGEWCGNPSPPKIPSPTNPPTASPQPTRTEYYPTTPDPDHSKTTLCKKPHSGTRLVQYALMLDAGSTGSRIHIYKFNHCGPSPAYEYEVFMQIQPGLSSFAGKPDDAAASLDVLLDHARTVVPSELQKCTPVQVKATAGLRLLPGSQSKDILDAVEKRLTAHYPFAVAAKDAVTIMDGKDEGVYAWITANYLLGTVSADTPRDTPTYAVLDLGGASTQIVFEPAFSKPDASLEAGEHKYDLEFAGRTRVLYQHSYLGFGLKRAREQVHRLVDFMSTLRAPLPDAADCDGGQPSVVTIDDGQTKRNVTMDGEEVGGFEGCARVVQLVLAKDAVCKVKPCAFDGAYQPSLLDAFPSASGRVLLLSYFYDRVAPLAPATAEGKAITIDEIANLARVELEGRPEWCLDLTFQHSLLRLGYEFEGKRDVVFGKKIKGTELGWCLGAGIALVGGELRCRI